MGLRLSCFRTETGQQSLLRAVHKAVPSTLQTLCLFPSLLVWGSHSLSLSLAVARHRMDMSLEAHRGIWPPVGKLGTLRCTAAFN